MKIAVISDPHAHPERLEPALRQVLLAAPDMLLCLGDLVGYGSDPGSVVKLVRGSADLCLLGNHDAAATGQLDWFFELISGERPGRLQEVPELLEDGDFEWLASRRPAALVGDTALFHGSAADPLTGFMTPPEELAAARAQLAGQPGPVSLVGHTHMPLAIGIIGGRIRWAEPAGEVLDLAEAERWILNPGSVGLRQFHRARDRRPCWMLLDLDRGQASWHRLGN